jgi:ribonuclease P protein component
VRKRAEFQTIQANGRRVSTASFVLLVYAREPGMPRLGITVSRKVGKAVVRSRAKRLIREAFRATRDLWPEDLDVVVIAKRPLSGKKLPDIVAEWTAARPELLRRVGEARKDRADRRTELAPGA